MLIQKTFTLAFEFMYTAIPEWHSEYNAIPIGNPVCQPLTKQSCRQVFTI